MYASDLNLATEEQSAKQLIKLQIYYLNGRYFISHTFNSKTFQLGNIYLHYK